MVEINSQAKRYREIVRAEFKLSRMQIPLNLDSDTALFSFLENLYNATKERLSSLINESASDLIIQAEKAALFVFSVGIFTFGRLNVVEDILAGIPGGKGSIRNLALVLNVLLPIPKGLDALRNPEEIKEWVKVKYSRLKWDETLERYILDNFRVLSCLPTDRNVEIFSCTENKKYEKELIVEIRPDTGHKWVGSFQPGDSNLCGVYQHPNRLDLIVISRGQAYVLNPENHQIIEKISGNISEVVELLESYFMLLCNTSGLLGYGSSGLLWKNTGQVWNSISQPKVEGNILRGKCMLLSQNNWQPFWLNIKTGEVQLKEFNQPKLAQKDPWWKL
jgi:hypothetical protein